MRPPERVGRDLRVRRPSPAAGAPTPEPRERGVTIAQAGALPYRLPLVRPLATAFGTVRARQGWILWLKDREGVRGIGDIVAHPAAPLPARGPVEAACRVLEGAQVAGLGDVRRFPIDGVTRPGVEMAVADLLARRRRIRAADLLGRVRRTRIPLNAVLSSSATVRELAAARRAGYRCVKLKVAGGDARFCTQQVRSLAAAAAGMRFRIDANGAFSFDEALAFLRALPVRRVEYVEDVVRDLEEMAELRRLVRIPLAADGPVRDVAGVDRIAALQAADLVVIKPSLSGLVAAVEMAGCARRQGLGVVVTSTLESSVGIAAAAHVAAVLPGRLRACGLATAKFFSGEPARPRMLPRNGALELLGRPGFGIDWRRE